MAGLFGFFNYSKPGPGISRDEPKKHSLFLFFDIYFRKFWKLVTLNLLFLSTFIIPVAFNYFVYKFIASDIAFYLSFITTIIIAGIATTGVSLILRNYVREENVFMWTDFVKTVKSNWKMAAVLSFIDLIAFYLLRFASNFYTISGFEKIHPNLSSIASGILLLVGLLFLFMHYYIFIMLVTFKITLKQLYKNAFLFAIIGLWRNVLITIVFAAIGYLIFITIPISIVMAVFIMFSTMGFVSTFLVYPLIKRYMIDPIKAEQPKEEEDKPIFKDDIT